MAFNSPTPTYVIRGIGCLLCGSFAPDRWLHATPKMKEALVSWGGGAHSRSPSHSSLPYHPCKCRAEDECADIGTVCLGQNIARLELMHATCEFFRTLADAKIAGTATPETMEYRDFFVIAPIGGKCEITLAHGKV